MTTIRNGYMSRKIEVSVPFSKQKEEIAKKLEKLGFLENVSVKSKDSSKFLDIKLKYDHGEPVISNINRISTPGLRVYRPKKSLRPVLGGMGYTLLSTSKGTMTNSESIKSGFGGEVICEVW